MFLGTIHMSIPSHITLALIIIQKCPFFDLEKSRRALAFACGALVYVSIIYNFTEVFTSSSKQKNLKTLYQSNNYNPFPNADAF